jgi:hypothetical protein
VTPQQQQASNHISQKLLLLLQLFVTSSIPPSLSFIFLLDLI